MVCFASDLSIRMCPTVLRVYCISQDENTEPARPIAIRNLLSIAEVKFGWPLWYAAMFPAPVVVLSQSESTRSRGRRLMSIVVEGSLVFLKVLLARIASVFVISSRVIDGQAIFYSVLTPPAADMEPSKDSLCTVHFQDAQHCKAKQLVVVVLVFGDNVMQHLQF